MARLKLKPPSSSQTECQKAFVKKMTQRLQNSYQSGLDMQCNLANNRVERLSNTSQKVLHNTDWHVFICFWITYLIILWLL
jgi:hypothetical protein